MKRDKKVKVIPVKYIGKNKGDREELTKIIEAQRKKGIKIPKNFNSPRYEWDEKTNRLIGIYWSKLRIKGPLNLNKLSGLKKVVVDKNQITSLHINKLKKLEELSCDKNKLKKLDVSKLSKLDSLCCNYNKRKSLNFNRNLGALYCKYNQLKYLDVSQCVYMEDLDCSHNKIRELELGYSDLGQLDCSYNQLEELDTSGLEIL